VTCCDYVALAIHLAALALVARLLVYLVSKLRNLNGRK